MKETFWLIRKTAMTTFKNYRNWLLYLVMPVVGIMLASMIYGGTEENVLNVGIVNQDHGQALTADTIQFIDRLDSMQTSEIEPSQSNDLIVSGKLDAVLTFPYGFAQSLKSGEPQTVQITSIKGTYVTSYVRMYLNAYIGNIASIGKAALGDVVKFDALYTEYMELDFRVSAMRTEDHSATNSMSKQSIGYLVILMLFSAVSLSGIMIKEKENRTYHRLLSAPITTRMYVASNVAVNLFVMMLQITVTLLVMIQLFRIDPGIPAWHLFLVLLIFALVAISWSLMIVAFADSSMKASALQNMIIIPTSLLAGCMFPIEMMPASIQRIGDFLPQQWLLNTIGKLQQGSPIGSIYLNVMILFAFALTFYLIATYKSGRNNDMRSYY